MEQITNTAEVWNIRPHTKTTAPVTGQPFKAKFEEATTADGKTATGLSGFFYRDSEGSTRTEFLTTREDLEGVIIIEIPMRHTLYLLHSVPRVGLQRKQDVRITSGGEWLFSDSNITEIDREMIEGIECRHFRTQASADGFVEEVWISDAHHAVLQESRRSRGNVTTWKLFDIQFTEQPQSLFEPPPDFTILQVDGPAGR